MTAIFVSMLALLALMAATRAQNTPALRSADLQGLRLRNIGPAAMSGRFVDLDVVESNPYTMYAASATGGRTNPTSSWPSRSAAICTGTDIVLVSTWMSSC